MRGVVYCVPTRGRPQQLIETVARSLANLSRPDTLLMVQADADDDETLQALRNQHFGERVAIDVREREDTVGAKWNRALEYPAQVYIAGGDDAALLMPDTDVKVLEAAKRFPDGIGMVYGHMANASFPSFGAMTAGFVQKLGHIYPEYFPYWFVDHWTDDVAKLIGRICFANLATDQRKPGKTLELREPAWWATWFDAGYMMRRKIAFDIIDSPDFQTPQWQKDILKESEPLVTYRSRFINSIVRQQAPQLEGWSGLKPNDARYQRVKQRAVEIVPHLLDDYGMVAGEAEMFRRALLGQQEMAA